MSLTPSTQTPREPLSRRSLALGIAEGVVVGGAYVVEAPLGEGGMGQVYLATDQRLDRKVALKVLPKDAADDEARARFLREARALGRIEHQNVVRVFASGDDDGLAWMALEVIDGEPLSTLLEGGAVDEETALLLAAQIARGLAAVHAVGVVHRDVKPSNILVDQEGTVKVIDFGVAVIAEAGAVSGIAGGASGVVSGFKTRHGVVVGTPHFMSPEQARGSSVDARSDAWGLGATIYALLTGEPPFAGDNPDEADLEILAKVLRDPIPDVRAKAPSTSSATVTLLSSLLHRDVAKRPGDLDAIASQLEALASGTVVPDLVVADAAPADEAAATATAATATTDVVAVVGADDARILKDEPIAGASMSPASVVAVIVAVGVAVAAFVAGWSQREIVERVVNVPVTVEVPVEVPIEVPVEVKVPVEVRVPVPMRPNEVVGAETDEEIARLIGAILALPPGDMDGAVAGLIDDGLTGADVIVLEALVVDAGPAADAVIARLDDVGDPTREHLIELAVMAKTTPTARALKLVQALLDRRSDHSLSALRHVATSHHDKRVRQAAAAARDSIFKVDDGP